MTDDEFKIQRINKLKAQIVKEVTATQIEYLTDLIRGK